MVMQKVKTVAILLLAVLVACAGAGIVYRAGPTAPAAAAHLQPAEVGALPPGEFPAAAATELPAPRPDEPEDSGVPADPDDQPPAKTPPRALAPPAGDAQPLRSRIGLINIGRVLKDAKQFQASEAELRTQTRKLLNRLQALNAQAQQLRTDRFATDPVEGPRIQARLTELQKQIDDEQHSGQKRLETLSSAAVVRMYRQVEEAANHIARARDLEVVLFYTDRVSEADFYKPINLQRKLAQPGALMPLVVAPGMDITQMVVQALDRRAAATGER